MRDRENIQTSILHNIPLYVLVDRYRGNSAPRLRSHMHLLPGRVLDRNLCSYRLYEQEAYQGRFRSFSQLGILLHILHVPICMPDPLCEDIDSPLYPSANPLFDQ